MIFWGHVLHMPFVSELSRLYLLQETLQGVGNAGASSADRSAAEAGEEPRPSTSTASQREEEPPVNAGQVELPCFPSTSTARAECDVEIDTEKVDIIYLLINLDSTCFLWECFWFKRFSCCEKSFCLEETSLVFSIVSS
jgi:hypothetical protein